MNTLRASITGVCLAFIAAGCGATDETDGDTSALGAGSAAPTMTGSTPPTGSGADGIGTQQPAGTSVPATDSTPSGSAAEVPGAPSSSSTGSGMQSPEATGSGEPTSPPPGTSTTLPDPTDTAPSDTAAPTSGPTETAPQSTDPPVTEPPEPEPEPTLVTSGQGAYWQVGQLTEMPGGNAELSVNESTTHQEWLGFGGTFNEAGWDVLSLLDAGERDRAIRLLFGASDGANFAWGRIPMGSSDFAMDRYALSETDGDYAMENFSIDRDRQLLIPYIKAALAVKPDIRLWGSPWSPPAWMKENGSMNGLVNGDDSQARIRNEEPVLDAYALYFARFVEDYAAEGLTIEHVQPQNEPGYATRYPSCLWSPELLRDFVRDHLGPTFEERGVNAEIWLGTMSAPEDTAHLTAVMADANAAKYVKGFGLQWNTIDSTSSLSSNYGFPVMQTEHKCGNYPWETATFNPDRPPNDHAYAEESWGLIRDWIVAGVNTYSAWNMVLDTQGQNLDWQRVWPQNALLTVDRQSQALTVTPAYYVFRHVSQYVDPGAVRVGTTGSLDALAFKNPDGSIVTVVYNSGGQPRPTTLGVAGTALQFEVPARGWATVNWQP